MKVKEVYRIITKEHGVALSLEALEVLAEKAKESELAGVAQALLARHPNQVVTKEGVIDVLSQATHDNVFIRSTPAIFANEGCQRYRLLKERLGVATQPIAALKEGSEQVIFGMVREEDTQLFLEDEDGVVPIETSQVAEEYFLASGVCVGLSGVLQEKVFRVASVLLPETPRDDSGPGRAKTSPGYHALFLANFSPVPENITKAAEVLQIYQEAGVTISAVVLMVEETDTMENALSRLQNGLCAQHPLIEFVVLPGRTLREYFYPYGEQRTVRNLTVTANPSEIVIGDRTLLVGYFNLIDGIKGRCAAQGNRRDILATTFLTQASYNPFVLYTDLSYPKHYDGVVIGDIYDSYVYNNSHQAFAICGEFNKNQGQFLFFSTETNQFEVSGMGGS